VVGTTDADAPAGVTFTRAGVLAGARRGVPIALASFSYGLVYGALARQAGLSGAEATLSSLLVFSGSAQFVALDQWAASPPVATLFLTRLVVSVRHLLMGAALAPTLAPLPRRRVYASAFFLTDENWALTMREVRAGSRNGALLLGSGLTLMAGWVGSTAIGHLAGGAIGDPARWGLDVAFIIVFTALLIGLWEGRPSLLPWAVAAAVAVAAERWLPGVWYIPLGGPAGGLAGAAHDGR